MNFKSQLDILKYIERILGVDYDLSLKYSAFRKIITIHAVFCFNCWTQAFFLENGHGCIRHPGVPRTCYIC